MRKTIGRFIGWVCIWICMYAIADYVLVIELNAWAMAWGGIASSIANYVMDLIEG